MKAYAVVRKPQPSKTTISHTFKLQKRNPEISIDPIQENRSLTPQITDSTLPEHVIQTKSRHFRVQESYAASFSHSKSPVRKHPIFNQMISEFMESKMRKQGEQKLNSSKLQQNIEDSYYEKKSINFSKVSEQQAVSQSKVQRKQKYTTPQKVRNNYQYQTPYQLLNSSQREWQIRPISINRKNKIFEQYRNTSKQKRLSYLQQSQDKSCSFKRALGPQLQSLHNKSQQLTHQKLINERQTVHHLFGALRSTKYDNVREQDLSSSEVDIGCCGEQLKQNKSGHYSARNEVSNRLDSSQKYRDNSIMNSIGLYFQAYSPQQSLQKSRRRIFSQVNPQLQKSNKKQTQCYKQDKIKAKPLPNQHKPKQRKVVVFEIKSYSPFEF